MLNDAEAKKKITTLTRTDFLLQFVWKPQTEEPPKTDEERQERLKQREEKVKEMLTKMQEEEKNNPAVKLSPQLERDLEAASRKKSEQIDSAVSKAIGAMGAGAGPAGAPGAAAPAAGAPAPGAAPPNPAAAPKQ